MKIAREQYEADRSRTRARTRRTSAAGWSLERRRGITVYPPTTPGQPVLRFRIDPEEQLELHIDRDIEDAGPSYGAIYHSHTRTRAEAVADRHQLRQALAGGAVDHRRARRTGSPTCGPGGSMTAAWSTPNWSWCDGRAQRAGRAGSQPRRPRCPTCGSTTGWTHGSAPTATCRWCCAAGVSVGQLTSATSARARSSRSSPRASSSASRRAQPRRGRVHPGLAARGRRPEHAQAHRRLRRPDFLAAGPRDVLVPEAGWTPPARCCSRPS